VSDDLLRRAHAARERQATALRAELAGTVGELRSLRADAGEHEREAAAQQERAERAEEYARSLEAHVKTLDAELARLRAQAGEADRRATAAEEQLDRPWWRRRR